jgi:hypothetical protein
MSVQLSVSVSEIVGDWNGDSLKESKEANGVVSWSLDV